MAQNQFPTTPESYKKPCLEIRINSINDAKAVVQHMGVVMEKLQRYGLSAIEFMIAEEVDASTRPILVGAFRCPTYRSIIAAKPSNTFAQIPPFIDMAKEEAIIKRAGRPKKIVTAEPEAVQ